jgi:hypothetical protein
VLRAGDYVAEALMLPAEGREELRVLDGRGIEKVALDCLSAPKRIGEPVADTQTVAFPYF